MEQEWHCGSMNGMVLPAPVPAIATQLRPNKRAFATSSCHSKFVARPLRKKSLQPSTRVQRTVLSFFHCFSRALWRRARLDYLVFTRIRWHMTAGEMYIRAYYEDSEYWTLSADTLSLRVGKRYLTLPVTSTVVPLYQMHQTFWCSFCEIFWISDRNFTWTAGHETSFCCQLLPSQ